MAVLIFFGLFILAIIIFIMKNPKPSQSQQPIHFDLLDENGNTLKAPVSCCSSPLRASFTTKR